VFGALKLVWLYENTQVEKWGAKTRNLHKVKMARMKVLRNNLLWVALNSP
jgi:hypothetical protein